MDTGVVTNLFALALALGIVALAVGAIVPRTRRLVGEAAPLVVSCAAVAATAGSLYLSEVAGFVPCTLCWYQRIAMYPLAAIVPFSVVVRDRRVLRYSLLLASIGLAVSLYHIRLQLFPDQSSGACELTNPCSATWVEAFGFVTIPQMAGATFAFIIAASTIGLVHDTRDQPVPRSAERHSQMYGQ